MQKAYHSNIALRLILIVSTLVLGLGAGFGAIAILAKSPGNAVGFCAFLGVVALMGVGTAVTALWLNRLILDGDRIKLARVGIFPFSILPHAELDLNRVKRWGVGQGADPAYGGVGGVIVGMAVTPAVLMFEVDGGNGKTYIRRIALGTYPRKSALEIFEHIEHHCGRPVELESSFFSGLTFPASRRWA